MTEIVDFLLARRSVPVATLRDPGPDSEHLQKILTAGARVPDHGSLTPWRFVVIQGDARTTLGECSARSFADENPDADQKKVEEERRRFERAPVVICVVASPREHFKIPEWEQILSVGAACQNILNASVGFGFGAQWLTQWPAYNADVSRCLHLEGHEKVAGFIYIGTADAQPPERSRPNLDDIVDFWTGPDDPDSRGI